MLLDARFWLALVVYSAIIFGGAYTMGHTNATDDAERAEQQRIINVQAAYQKLAQAAVDQERKLRKTDRKEFDRAYKELKDEKANVDKLVTDLRRDVVRLRVPVRNRCPAATTDGSTTAPPSGEGYAELTPDASVFLVGLLARGDAGIKKHAELVDTYERLRTACNAQPEAPK